MNCHSETWAVAPALEPVRESYRTGKSIQWMPLHDLPQFVSFNQSVHVHEKTGCSECHGQSRFAIAACTGILSIAYTFRDWMTHRAERHWRQDRRRYRKMLAFTGSAAKVGP
jgi:hypothetical protein